MSRGRV